MEETEFEEKCSISAYHEKSLVELDDKDKRSDPKDSKVTKSNLRPRSWYRRGYCRFYQYGQCAFGEKCRFLHEKPLQKVRRQRTQNLSVSEHRTTTSETEIKNNFPIDDDSAVGSALSKEKEELPKHITGRLFRPGIVRPRVTIIAEQLGSEAQKDCRKKDIVYFKKRFPKSEIRDVENNVSVIQFIYDITEPDWPFDVNSLTCVFSLPAGYPIERAHLRLTENYLPRPLFLHIEKEMDKFLKTKYEFFESKNSFEPVGRQIVRWLDKTVLDLFVTGLKKTKLVFEAESAGISVIMPSASNEKTEVDQSVVEEEADTEIKEEECLEKCVKDCILKQDVSSSDDLEFGKVLESKEIAATKEAIEVRVSWNNVSGNIASLTATSLAFQIRCMKCNSTGFMTCSARELATAHCKQCKNRQSMVFEPKLVHEFSNVIALLEPKGCRPVDCVLLSSCISFVCLGCIKSAIAENLSYGAAHKTWCRSCHSKCEFSVLSVRFFGNVHSIAVEDSSLKKLEVKKKKKPEQQIVIAEGKPLPSYGTCKHYKKSFRWFRFPCCGKVYPCDQCHNEVETEHEMKFANRIVCGFCSREQPFLGNNCSSCKNSVVNIRSAFWEGGKGCRDKTKLSRNDRKKYTNSDQKTASKKHGLQKEKQKSRND